MPDARITHIHAREVLDSRGRPTVEADVHTASGMIGRAIAPSGASTGQHEAIELRDGDRSRYRGLGVRQAVRNVRESITPRLMGMDANAQAEIDASMIELDGTPNKARLGANAILAVSLACAQAAAQCAGVPLWRHLARANAAEMPLPMVNLISGGKHAGGQLDFQDYLFLPIGATTYHQALEWTVEVYQCLGDRLRQAGYEGTLVGDEGGFGPRLRSNEEALEFIVRAIEHAGLKPGRDAAIALDVAATHFYRDGAYHLRADGMALSAEQMVEKLHQWCAAYPIRSIEDGLAEDDWEGWRILTLALGERVQLIGDDLFVTNPLRLERGQREGIGNAVLVKLNQIGTLTETLTVLRWAKQNGYRTIVSARSGETEDATMADLAVGMAAGQIKVGSIVRSERLAKYNQLLRIGEELPGTEHFAVWNDSFARR